MNKHLINFLTGILLIILGIACGTITSECFQDGSHVKAIVGFVLSVLSLYKGGNLISKSIIS